MDPRARHDDGRTLLRAIGESRWSASGAGTKTRLAYGETAAPAPEDEFAAPPEFDRVFVVGVSGSAPATLLQARYGPCP